MRRIKDYLKLSIIIMPTVIITLSIFEKTNNVFYALLALIVTCSIMTLILYYILKYQKKQK